MRVDHRSDREFEVWDRTHVRLTDDEVAWARIKLIGELTELMQADLPHTAPAAIVMATQEMYSAVEQVGMLLASKKARWQW